MDGKTRNDEGKDAREPGVPPAKPAEDNDVEDGDFATPKRGVDGDDDQPLK